MTPPLLTDEQRDEARAAALASRQEIAAIRRSVRQGVTSAKEILESPEGPHGRMRVRDLLCSVPGIGPTRCALIMETVGIAPTRRVRGLSARQRADLIRALTAREDKAAGAARIRT